MLQRISLQHVGPAERLDIEFSSRVNLITGDNGLGKSFLLDIAWWALTQTWAHYPARPDGDVGKTPTISFAYDAGGSELVHTSRFNRRPQSWSGLSPERAVPGLVLYAQVDGSFAVWDPARNGEQNLAYLFSPTEIWDGLSRPDQREASRTEVLCNGLIRDWASWQKEQGEAYAQLCSVLKGLSSEGEPLAPGALTRIRLGDVRDMPTLKMPYGREVAIVHASAAVRRIVALAYLLVWSWREHLLASRLLRFEAPVRKIILLIDEAEAHLHPTWQRRILRSLLEVVDTLTGVDVQVIAVTHSPMLLASMEPMFDPARDSLWVFDLAESDGGPAVRLRKDSWHRRGDASSWLQSPIFDLKEARSVEAEEALTAARSLMARDVADAAEFARIYDALQRSMPGDDPFWVDWRAWAWGRGLLRGEVP